MGILSRVPAHDPMRALAVHARTEPYVAALDLPSALELRGLVNLGGSILGRLRLA